MQVEGLAFDDVPRNHSNDIATYGSWTWYNGDMT